ncbi:MAG: Inositol 2-dehydrogenase/D-chiro-inositol 3-dehydrogenase [Gemmatimonadaceae bacterium]|nr:Inositol 2-dehydrogenase/D-chiro-inositol 3-dehydrogenase [Gemmatimonadaceae bacterium]
MGAGALGFHHVRLLRDLPGIEFTGFFDARASRADEVVRELGVRSFGNLDDLIVASDALTIVVPTPDHFAVSRRALSHGRHLLIEKPLATTLEEADELLHLATSKGALIQTGHVERFNRAIRAALPYVDRPLFIESDRLAPFNPRGSDVAVVLDLMIHDIDLILTLVSSAVESVAAVGVPVLTPFVDIANARLTFDSGAVANITSSRVSRERLRKLRIFQRSGYLSLDLGSGDGEFYRLMGDLNLAELMRSPQQLEAFVERIALSAPEGEPLRLEFEAFRSALLGETPVVVDGRAGREALAVALRIVREIERTLPAAEGGGRSGSRRA